MTKIDYNYLSIPYKNKKTLFKGLLGHCKAKNMSPSDSTSKTEEKAASFISVECHFGSEKEKRIFLKKGPDSNPFFGPKKNLLCFPLAIQSERHVQ